MCEDKIKEYIKQFRKLPKHRQESILNIIHLMTKKEMFKECALCGKDVMGSPRAMEMSDGIYVCGECQFEIYTAWREDGPPR